MMDADARLGRQGFVRCIPAPYYYFVVLWVIAASLLGCLFSCRVFLSSLWFGEGDVCVWVWMGVDGCSLGEVMRGDVILCCFEREETVLRDILFVLRAS